MEFQRNPHIFCIEQHSETYGSTGRSQARWTIKDGGLEPDVDIIHKFTTNHDVEEYSD